MATLASLNIQIGANAAKFVSGFDLAARHVGKFGSALSGTLGHFLNWKSALAGLVGGVGLTAFIRQQFEAIDQLGHMSDKLSINVELLAKLAYVSDMAEAPLEDVGTAVRHMSANLGKGTEDVRRIVGRIKLDFDSLRTMAPEDTFLAIGDAINKLPNAYARAEAWRTIFSRGGQEMQKIFGKGAEQIRAWMAEAPRVTLLDVAKVELADEALKRMKWALADLGKTATVELTPVFYVLAEIIEGWAKSLKSVTAEDVALLALWFGELADDIKAATIEALKFARVMAVEIPNLLGVGGGKQKISDWWSLDRLGEQLSEVDRRYRNISRPLADWLGGTSTKAIPAPLMPSVADNSAVQTIDAMLKSLESSEAPSKRIADFMQKAYDKVAEMRTRIAAGQGPIDDTAESVEAMAKQVEKWINDTTTPLEKYRQNMMEVTEAFMAGAINADLFGKVIGKLRADLAAKEIEAAAKRVEAYQDKVKGWFDSTRTPMEKYLATMAEINDAIARGAIGWDLWGRMQEDAYAPVLAAKMKLQSPTFPGAALQGTLEGYRAVIGARSQEALLKDILTTNREATIELKKQTAAANRAQRDQGILVATAGGYY